ncbi:adenosylhomocysteinase [Burkholderia ubonensis]|uniref:Adenosylhomocysteinase n=1 Tax=Burkholderia ubonensis TaxID=101571 RepID=A0A102KTB3_9BURK|nr:adenosylhomocysteinase [Burkholderia ubonensis]KUZ68599.1 adenosylhomocysteinase [Burkholderia ubonensis]KUZ71905.1 adenosylhomocysteinase [Burkholderia ubonensis]KUZ81056.1 adenosylhomocysteinase [Burkholderia ubonensis]KUZ98654.1 adenosylhomocysteinase [Burkholderia ubonensis]KVC52435.1 adenosylhomocysteinase [Burkholderia ubonensis]
MNIHSSHIADIKLADEGRELTEWARRSMPVLESIRQRFERERPLAGRVIGACLHITAETSNLIETLRAGGAKVFLCASNPISTQDPVTAYLSSQGVHVYAIHGEDLKTYESHCRMVLDAQPHVVIDDGGDLTKLLHSDYAAAAANIVGGLEETTTGVIRVKNLERMGGLKYPIIAINDSKTKHMFDNRYGTGQSTVDAILRATNMLLAGKKFVVAGFGMCGRGVAMRAAGMGADVIVTEIDPVRALEAVMEGFRVMPMDQAAPLGDVFVTVTGNKSVIDNRHFASMKDNVVLANAGHFDCEIDLVCLRALSSSTRNIRSDIEQFTLVSGQRISVLAEGRLVNLCAAEGHPAEVMDMSFANQALGCEYLLKHPDLPISVLDMPAEVDTMIASMKLASRSIEIDVLTPEQRSYLDAWEEGTKKDLEVEGVA